MFRLEIGTQGFARAADQRHSRRAERDDAARQRADRARGGGEDVERDWIAFAGAPEYARREGAVVSGLGRQRPAQHGDHVAAEFAQDLAR